MNIYAKTFGNGKDIVLIHGWGFGSVVMNAFAELLAKNYRVTLLDLPGYGQSDECENYSLGNIAQLISPLLPDNCILIAWSLGGLWAIKLANLVPHKIKKIITLSTNPCFISNESWLGVSPEIFSAFEHKLEKNPEELLTHFMLLQTMGADKQKIICQNIKKMVFEDNLLPSMQTLKAGLEILKSVDTRELLKRMDQPILFILSNDDYLVPMAIGEKIKNLNANIKVAVMDNASHMAFLTKPNELALCVDEFIRESHGH
jgi:pimeloyl-[acyl-carrier protein] methyl ester esterase